MDSIVVYTPKIHDILKQLEDPKIFKKLKNQALKNTRIKVWCNQCECHHPKTQGVNAVFKIIGIAVDKYYLPPDLYRRLSSNNAIKTTDRKKLLPVFDKLMKQFRNNLRKRKCIFKVCISVKKKIPVGIIIEHILPYIYKPRPVT